MSKEILNRLESLHTQLADWRNKLQEVCRLPNGYLVAQDLERYIGGANTLLHALYGSMGEFAIKERRKMGAIPFHSRGIGLESGECFVCGTNERNQAGVTCLNNISGYIDSKDDGEEMLKFFKRGAKLDWRGRDSHKNQFKIFSCDRHLPNLRELERRCREDRFNGICHEDVAFCWRNTFVPDQFLNLPWGTNGIKGNHPTKWVFLGDCSSNHLENILEQVSCVINHPYINPIKEILKARGHEA